MVPTNKYPGRIFLSFGNPSCFDVTKLVPAEVEADSAEAGGDISWLQADRTEKKTGHKRDINVKHDI